MQRWLRQRRSFLMRAKRTTRLRESGLLQCDRSQQRITPSRGQVLPSPPHQFLLGPFGDLFQTEPPDIKRARNRKLWECLMRRSGWKIAFSSRLPAATTSLRFCRKTVSSHPAVAHRVIAVFSSWQGKVPALPPGGAIKQRIEMCFCLSFFRPDRHLALLRLLLWLLAPAD